MVQRIRSVVFIVIGVVSLGLSIGCYTIEDLDYESRSIYGGDAFTGIQNAAAVTSRNIKELARIVQFGFGSVLLVMGITFVGVGVTALISVCEEDSELDPDIIDSTSSTEG